MTTLTTIDTERMIRTPGATVFMPEMIERDGRAFTSSINVAECFGKAHKNVLRSIEALIAIEPKLRGLNFEPTQERQHFPNGGYRDTRSFLMDKDGFALLVMGFSGQRAILWRLRFIEAFNAMSEQLQQRNTPARREYSAEAADSLMDSRDLLRVTWMALQAKDWHDADHIDAIANTVCMANRMLERPYQEINEI